LAKIKFADRRVRCRRECDASPSNFYVIDAQRARRKSEMQLYWNLPFGSASLLSTQFAPCYSQSCHEPPPPQIILSAIGCGCCCCMWGTTARVLCVCFFYSNPYNRQISSKITFALHSATAGVDAPEKARRKRPQKTIYLFKSARGVIRAAPR
jgi:hypothetical protein